MDCRDYADILEAIPAFSTCTRSVIEEFVAVGANKAHFAAGKTLRPRSLHDQNLCVVVSGSLLLNAGDDVVISLEPGDYFGKNAGRRLRLASSVVAVSDVELLVITPRQITALEEASSRSRHPSQIDWYVEPPATPWRAPRRGRSRAALAYQNS
jgi:CRP-like cAMP-binding protein